MTDDLNKYSRYHRGSFYIYLRQGILDADGQQNWPMFHEFMHEYTHLIQDRSTIYGCAEFLKFNIGVRDLVQQLRNSWSPRLSMPLETDERLSRSFSSELRWSSAVAESRETWGEDGPPWAVEEVVVDWEAGLFEGRPVQLPRLRCFLIDNTTGAQLEHLIGAWEIREAYAAAVQRLWGGRERVLSGYFEYIIIERLVSKYWRVDQRQLIAICHWALQDALPAQRLQEILTLLSEAKVLPDAESLYDVLRLDALKNGFARKVADLSHDLDACASEQMHGDDSDAFGVALRWYAEGAKALLEKNMDTSRRFPLDTVLAPETLPVRVRDLERLWDEVPVPQVENFDGDLHAYGGGALDERVVLFVRSFVDVVDMLWGNHRAHWSCPLIRACELSCKDASCGSRPWVREASDCVYGLASAYLDVKGFLS